MERMQAAVYKSMYTRSNRPPDRKSKLISWDTLTDGQGACLPEQSLADYVFDERREKRVASYMSIIKAL